MCVAASITLDILSVNIEKERSMDRVKKIAPFRAIVKMSVHFCRLILLVPLHSAHLQDPPQLLSGIKLRTSLEGLLGLIT